MRSTGVGDSDVAAGAAARLVVEYDDVDELIADCAQTLAHGQTVVATSRLLADRAPVRLALAAPGLLAPIPLAGTVAAYDAATGEATIQLGAADGRRLAELMARLRKADPELVGRVVRVLIAEDNPHLAQLISNGLVGISKRGIDHRAGVGMHFDFQTVVDGAYALNVLQARRFDVAIIDVYLPTVSGPQVIEAARRGLARDLPIIAVSSGGPSACALAQEAGCDVFLAKPFRLRDLYDTILTLVRRRGLHPQPSVA